MVAGCLLPDAVLLGSDCRVSLATRNVHARSVSSRGQTLVRLGDGAPNVIGYSVHLETVSMIFGHLLGPHLSRRRLDAISTRRWLPRYLRDLYARLRYSYPNRVGSVSFIVASTMRGR